MNQHKTIGIIGGQGPISTADFYMRIIKYYQDNFGAKYLKDFPAMVIFSVPAPDLISGVENEELIFNMIGEAAQKLERDECAFIVIACNSVQFLLERLQTLVKIPIVGIAQVTAEEIKTYGYKSVGILATDTTIRKDVYGKPLHKYGINLIAPDEVNQEAVQRVIYDEISGDTTNESLERLKNAVKELQVKGAEAVLLACTELPLIIQQAHSDIPLIDCNQLYAKETAIRSQ